MNHMHEALKKKMLEMKSGYKHDENPDGHDLDAAGKSMDGHEKIDADGKPEGSDLAPPLHNLDEEHEINTGEEGSEVGHVDKMGELIKGAEGEEQDQHRKILESLSDGGNMGQKGSGGGLRERVAMGAKGRLASLLKK